MEQQSEYTYTGATQRLYLDPAHESQATMFVAARPADNPRTMRAFVGLAAGIAALILVALLLQRDPRYAEQPRPAPDAGHYENSFNGSFNDNSWHWCMGYCPER